MVESLLFTASNLSEKKDQVLSERNIYICHALHNKQDLSDASGKWMNSFVDFLGAFLKRVSKSNYRFFYSGKGIDVKDAINRSNVFIFILDADFKQSSVFLEEVKLIQERVSKDEKNILFVKILKSPVAASSEPPFLLNIFSHCFFDTETRSDNVKPLRKDDNVFTAKIVLEKLADVAYTIEKFYDTSKNLNSEEDPKFTIYLAETTADQSFNRDVIKRELEQFGYRVLPDKQLPDESEDFIKTVTEYLEKSDLSIHIIGQEYGEIPKGEVHSVTDLQNKIAANFKKDDNSGLTHFSRIIWISPDLKITTDIQKSYIENLKRNREEILRAEILQTPLELFKSFIINKLENLASHEAMETEKHSSKIKLYIIHELTDTGNIQDMAKWLKNNNIEPILSYFSENDISHHRQNLVECDAVIIYNSGDNLAWLQSKIIDLLKAPGYGRMKPFLAKAVFMLQSKNNIGDNLLDDFIILTHHKKISEVLQPLYDQLKQNNEGSHFTNPAL